jgi:hypothetical protein
MATLGRAEFIRKAHLNLRHFHGEREFWRSNCGG